MGTRGPVPKREESRQRRNQKETPTVKAPGAEEVSVPEADPAWHPIAKRVWDAAVVSGQARFYEPSDWAVLFSLMDDLSDYKMADRRSGQMLQTIMSSLSSLLLTEGDRRRLQIELARPSAEVLEDAGVAEMKKWRERLASG